MIDFGAQNAVWLPGDVRASSSQSLSLTCEVHARAEPVLSALLCPCREGHAAETVRYDYLRRERYRQVSRNANASYPLDCETRQRTNNS